MVISITDSPPILSPDILKVVALLNVVAMDSSLIRAACGLWTNYARDHVHSSQRLKREAEDLIEKLKTAACDEPLVTYPSMSCFPPVSPTSPPVKPRYYIDGVFDLCHSGHYNALRQVHSAGGVVVVGVSSDEVVLEVKKVLPIFTAEERAELVRGCRWSHEVVSGVLYTPTPEFVHSLNCDYVAHGDDLALDETGQDCYRYVRDAGLMRYFQRTIGVSTTSTITKMLTAVGLEAHGVPNTNAEEGHAPLCANSQTPSLRLREFIGNRVPPKKGDKVVYVSGSFDIFHVGHLRLLQKAKALGGYLIVGIYDDSTVQRYTGRGFPIIPMIERSQAVLAMQVVDEVLLGAPFHTSEAFLKSQNISVVVSTARIDSLCPRGLHVMRSICKKALNGRGAVDSVVNQWAEEVDVIDLKVYNQHSVPKSMGIYQELDTYGTLTTLELLRRIVTRWDSINQNLAGRCKKEQLAQQSSVANRTKANALPGLLNSS